MKREHTEPIMINLPISLIASMTKYINERRFESYSELAKEAIQTWIDCSEQFRTKKIHTHCSYCGKELIPGSYVGVNKDEQAFCQKCWPNHGNVKTIKNKNGLWNDRPQDDGLRSEQFRTKKIHTHCSYCGKELIPGSYVGVNKDEQAFCQKCWPNHGNVKTIKNKNGLWNDRPQDDDDADNLYD